MGALKRVSLSSKQVLGQSSSNCQQSWSQAPRGMAIEPLRSFSLLAGCFSALRWVVVLRCHCLDGPLRLRFIETNAESIGWWRHGWIDNRQP